MDADGDLDVLIAGYYVVYFQSVDERLTLYRNDGPVNDSTWASTPLPVDATGLYFGSTDRAFGDYDNDGDPDVVVGTEGETALYRIDGGTLNRTPTTLPPYWEVSDFSTMDLHSLSWADFDNDGDLDLLDVTPYGGNFMNVYRNDLGAFAPADTALAFMRYGMADWGDADGDGDLDYFAAGGYYVAGGNGLIEARTQLFRNDATTANAPPSVPASLQATPTGSLFRRSRVPMFRFRPEAPSGGAESGPRSSRLHPGSLSTGRRGHLPVRCARLPGSENSERAIPGRAA